MSEVIRETVSTENTSSPAVKETTIKNNATSFQTIEYLVYFAFGFLEVLLVFRLLLKLAGASITSAFVGLIYGITGVFILPFEGIFRRAVTTGQETNLVLEPAVIVAIIAYAVLAFGSVYLIRILSGERQED